MRPGKKSREKIFCEEAGNDNFRQGIWYIVEETSERRKNAKGVIAMRNFRHSLLADMELERLQLYELCPGNLTELKDS